MQPEEKGGRVATVFPESVGASTKGDPLKEEAPEEREQATGGVDLSGKSGLTSEGTSEATSSSQQLPSLQTKIRSKSWQVRDYK